jgi:hypothetical protein
VTLLFASATPVIVGAVMLVMRSAVTPLSDAADSSTVGAAAGAAVSIVIETTAVTAEVLPAASVDVAVIGCVPSLRVGEVNSHAPFGATVVVPSSTPSS